LTAPGNRALAVPLNKAKADLFSDPKVEQLVKNPSKRMLRMEAILRNMSEDSTRRLLDDGVDVDVDRRIALEKIADNPEAFAKDAAKAESDLAEYDRIVDQIAESGEKATPAQLAKLRELGDTLDADKIRQFAQSPNSETGGVKPYIWPHYMKGLAEATPAELAQYQRATAQLAKPGALGNAKLNRAWLHDMGLTMLDPKAVRWAHTNIVKFQHRRKMWERGLAMALDGDSPKLPANRKGWVNLAESSEFRRYADSVSNFLREDAPVLFGDAAETELNALRSMFEKALETKFPGQQKWLPKSVFDELTADVRRSNSAIGRVYDTIQNSWRFMALNLSGLRWLSNNIVGQFIMLAVTNGLLRSAWNLAELGVMSANKTGGPYKAIGRHAPQIEQAGLFHTEAAQAGHLAGRAANMAVAPFRGYGNMIGKLNEILSDDIPRRTAFWMEVKPSVRRLIDSGEAQSVDDALRLILSDERTAHRLTDKVIRSLVDFRDLSPFERQYMRRMIPFYAWVKGSTVRTTQLMHEHPFRMQVLMKGGELAADDNEDKFGGVLPKYLASAIPVGKRKDGKQKVLTTSSMNPFMTPADILTQAAGVFRGGERYGTEGPFANFSPLLKTPIEAAMNKDLFYGGKLDYTGDQSFAERLARRTAQQVPQVMWVEKYKRAKNPPKDYTGVYEPSKVDLYYQILGVPRRTVNVDEALKRGKQEQAGVRKPWL
jgi:hypothetical protein